MLALLVDANQENAQIVVDRILQKYQKEAGGDAMLIDYEAQPLMPEEQVY